MASGNICRSGGRGSGEVVGRLFSVGGVMIVNRVVVLTRSFSRGADVPARASLACEVRCAGRRVDARTHPSMWMNHRRDLRQERRRADAGTYLVRGDAAKRAIEDRHMGFETHLKCTWASHQGEVRQARRRVEEVTHMGVPCHASGLTRSLRICSTFIAIR